MTGGPGAPAERRIGRYRVEAVLGAGAFATVYRAVDERLDDTVAVKVLAENHSLDPELRKRFLTEGRVLRRVDSPHVLDVHDLGETDRQQPFLVLEYASRGTLAQRGHALRSRGWHPTPADLWSVAEPLARALAAVHRIGVVHRDVNPANVLLTTRGVPDGGSRRSRPTPVVGGDERLVLADLGLCKDLALHSGHTSAGGTEGFRPPELRRGPAIIDSRADLWSLSAMVVWLATGSPPEDGVSEPGLVAAGLPTGLARVLARGLAHDPAARQSDADAWLADVAAAVGPPAPAPPPPPPPPSPPAPAGPAGPGGPGAAVLPASSGPRAASPASAAAPGSPAGPSPVSGGPGSPAVSGSSGAASSTPGAPAPPVPGGPWAGGSPVPSGPWGAAPARRPPWTWYARESLWLLAALPFGLTTWAGFLAVGLRAKRDPWVWAAIAYAVGAVVLVTLAVVAPVDEDGKTVVGSWENTAGIVVLAVLWFGGIAHSLVVHRTWLRLRSAATGGR